MPAAVGAAIISGLASGVSISAAGAISFSLTAGGFALAAGGALLSSVGSMLISSATKSGKKKTDNTASATQNVRQAISTHKLLFGQKRVGDAMIYVGSSENNLYLHVIVMVAAHQVSSIDEVWFGDDCIPNDALDASGNVISGKYSGYARIRKVLGSPAQAADPMLAAEMPEWTANHRLRGRAYVYVRLKFSQDVYSSGIPNITTVARGKALYDPRDGNFKFTCNPALMVREYLVSAPYGLDAATTIDDASIIAAANVCDEMVAIPVKDYRITAVDTGLDTLAFDGENMPFGLGDRVYVTSTGTVPAGLVASTDYWVVPYQWKNKLRVRLATSLANAMAGVTIDLTSAGSGQITLRHTGEPRFHAAAYLDTANALGDNLATLLSGFGGEAVYAGGMWRLYAATYQTPTLLLDEGDMIGPIQIKTKVSRSDRFNRVKGVYNSHINGWVDGDYPPAEDAFAVDNDGQTIDQDLKLPVTNRPHTAKRLAKIVVKQAAQEISFTAPFNLKAMQAQAGETVMISNSLLGWVAKPFEVTEFKFTLGGSGEAPQLGIELTLRETALAIYDDTSSEDSSIDPAPNSTLPSAFNVLAVTGLLFDSVPLSTVDGDTYFGLVLEWSEHPDAFVREGGRFEVQYRRQGDADYLPSFFVDGRVTRAQVAQASVGTQYDLRIRAVNNMGISSNWQTIEGAVAGTGGGIGSTSDWGNFAGSPATSADWGDFSAPPTTTNDWGSYS